MWVWLDWGLSLYLRLKDGYGTQRFMWEDKSPSPLKVGGLATSSFTELLQC